MPAQHQRKKPPITSQRKQMIYAIHLAQPFLQFFALMAVLFFLSRCSPLSSSSDKSPKKSASDNSALATPSDAALEEDIKKAEREIGDAQELALVTKSNF